MKTRSSSGVGQKVDLEFNVDTLRITDLGEEEESQSFSQQRTQGTSSMINGFKRTSVVSTATSDDQPASTSWERASPKEGFNLDKPKPKPAAGPSIRNMLNNLNPEKD